MKKTATARWMQTATMESLEARGYATMGAVLKHGGHVLVVGMETRGYHAAVYEFIETPEETGLGSIECRLGLAEAADGLFEDGGHAMAWCMARI